MKLRIAILAGVLLCSAQASALEATAPAADPAASRVDRMTDLLLQAVPFGRMFEMASKGDPNWPVQDRPRAVDATQLACLRSELSAEGFRRNKRSEVAAYVAAHPKQVDEEIGLMQSGASELMGRAMMAGAESGISGKDVDANAVLSDATPEQFLAFIRFINAPEFADLRKLSGIGDAIDLTDSARDTEKNGERLGMDMASKAILQAVGTCRIPMSALLAPQGGDS